MKKLLMLTIALFAWNANTFAQTFQKLVEEGYMNVEPEYNLFKPQATGLHYQYEISGKSTYAGMSIGFKNCSSWQKLRLNATDLREVVENALATVGDSITKNTNTTIKLRKTNDLDWWMMEYDIKTEPKIIVSDLKSHTKPAKLDYDTLNILISGGESNQYVIYYQITGYDLHAIGNTFWDNVAAGNQKIDSQMQEIATKKRPDAFSHQIVGHLVWDQEKGYRMESRKNTFSNAIRNTVFIDASIGPYFGIGNISTNLDAVIGFYMSRTYANYRPFIGLNSGNLNTKINADGITSDRYLGIEIGGVRSKELPTFVSGPRTSIVLGVFNTHQDKGIFYNKPQFYLAIKYPLWSHVQLTFHLSSTFNKKDIDYNKYLYGISTNISIGSLFN